MAGKTHKEMATRIEQATKQLMDTFWRRVAENGGLPPKPKSVRERRAEVLHKFGLEVAMQCQAPGGSIKAALDALEAIDRGEW